MTTGPVYRSTIENLGFLKGADCRFLNRDDLYFKCKGVTLVAYAEKLDAPEKLPQSDFRNNKNIIKFSFCS